MATMRRASSFSTSKILENPMFSQLSQQAQTQTQDGKKTVMFFVIPPGKSKESCENLSIGRMFQTAEAHLLSIQWITDSESTEQVLESDGNIFVFDPFGKSPGFQFWTKKMKKLPFRVELLGSQVLRYVFTSQDVLKFQTKGLPTFTLAMRGMIISLSGFKDKEKKDELEQLVRWMNGSLSTSLTKAVTHVVTVNAGTPKSIEAHKGGIPVMTEEWIREVWKDNQSSAVDASDRRYVKFSCPVFHNLKICMSGITASKKATLKNGIERLGGSVRPELIKGEIDFLVVMKPEGEKYKYARKWKVNCVTPEWVEHSTEKGHVLPYEQFVPKKNEQSASYWVSTPMNSILAEPEMNFSRCSEILDNTRMMVNATTEYSQIQNDTAVDVVTELRAVKKSKTYLDGCRIYLVDHEKCDELKKEVNLSGAVRLNQLSNGVTHIVVPQSHSKLPKSVEDCLLELEATPYLVTTTWLLESAKQGSPADEELYKFDVVVNVCQDSSIAAPENPRQESAFLFAKPGGRNPSQTTNRRSNGQRSVVTNSVTTTTTTSKSCSTTTSSRNAITDVDDSSTDSDSTQGPPPPPTHHNDSVQNLEDDGTSNLLSGMSFKVVTPYKDEVQFLEELITKNGGILKKQNPKIIILPSICKASDLKGTAQFYTKYWLMECLEFNSFEIEAAGHHNPRAAFDGMENVLEGIVVAISQYPVSEREYIIELVTALGGRYQEVFTRRDSKTGARSTHLICSDLDGDKPKAAKRWDVPVVLAEWVYDSFDEKKYMEEHRYDPSHLSTADERTVYMPTPQRKESKNGGNNKNTSTYPPSTQKGGRAKVKILAKNGTPEPAPNRQRETTPEPGPSCDNDDGPTNDNVIPTPSFVPPAAAAVVPTEKPTSANGHVDFEDGTTIDPVEAELLRKIEESKAAFPYTDESFENFLQDLKSRGINYEDAPSFTSFEERRMLDTNPDSPLLLGLPRKESRALKEHFEIAMARSPRPPDFKLRRRSSPIAMSAWTERFKDIERRRAEFEPSPTPSPRPSNSKNLKKVAAVNRLSLPNTSPDTSIDDHLGLETNVNPGQAAGLGITKLGSKRPSDGSPDDESKSTKRAKQSVEEPTNEKESISPNRNVLHKEPAPSNSLQAVADLIASHAKNSGEGREGISPFQRRSGGEAAKLLLDVEDGEDADEDIERPHVSWVGNDEEPNTEQKKSAPNGRTSKDVVEVELPPAEPEPAQLRGRTRSSKVGKTNPTPATEDGGKESKRTRRTRSRSKTRKETVPVGHQPIKLRVNGQQSSRKKKRSFPLQLPANPVFMISSVNGDEKTKVLEMLAELGGSVSKLKYYDEEAVGILTGALLRSEKILGCIATGKFVLKPEYIVQSHKKGKFLPVDEEFLWHEGNVNLEKERDLARASFNWLKVQMEDETKKPMYGVRVCVVDQVPEKQAAFRRLVEASGGIWVESIDEADLILKDDKSTVELPDDKNVENLLYINNIILSEPA